MSDFKAEHLRIFNAFLARKNLGNVHRTEGTPLSGERYMRHAPMFNYLLEAANTVNRDLPAVTHVGPQPYLHIGFAEDSRCIARAEIFEGKPFIYFHAGMLLTLASLFARMLAHPDVLPHIGNPSLESADGPHAWRVPEEIVDYEEVVQARFQAGADDPELIVGPKCPVRDAYAVRLTNCAFDYLFFHEVAHHFFGHIRLKSHLNGMNFLEDSPGLSGMGWTEGDGWTPMVSQALEYDADSYGAHWSLVLNMHRTQMLTLNDAPDDEGFEEMLRGVHEALCDSDVQLWAFAIAVTFRWMGFEPVDLNTIRSFSHPPITMRLHIGAATGSALLQKRGWLPERTQLIGAGMVEADKAYACVTGMQYPMLRHYVPMVKDHATSQYLSLLETTWQELIDSLRPLAWWNLTNDPVIAQNHANYVAAMRKPEQS